MTSCKFLRT
jgi:hypothetical protein